MLIQALDMETKSYWNDSSARPHFGRINANHQVDVVVVGAGITGVTAAYLLKNAGHTVALVDRGQGGGFDTLNTTAHLTCVTDMRLHELVSHFGKAAAGTVWEGGRQAIDHICANIQRESLECDFTWVPGYLHADDRADASEIEQLEKDANLANELGFSAVFEKRVPLINRPGVEFPHQAKFDPGKYISGLLRTIPGKGSYVFTQTEVTKVESDPLSVQCDNYRIQGGYVILATHTPLMGKTGSLPAALFQTKLFLYTTYALGARLPTNGMPEASFWDTAHPYHYLRIDHHEDCGYAIFGGEDHKTGQVEHSAEPYHRLEERLGKLLPQAQVDHRWSGQVIETPDGLPYIGETADRQFVATGFSGNGMTFGTLGALMAVDSVAKRTNPWQTLFDVHRKPFHGGTLTYLKENSDYPYHMLRDWLAGSGKGDVNSIGLKQGKVLSINGRRVAAYRNEAGQLSLCSPVCTHLKCIVAWNEAERTWDCPCHGSRFAPTGEVLAGPAEQPLEKIEPPAA